MFTLKTDVVTFISAALQANPRLLVTESNIS